MNIFSNQLIEEEKLEYKSFNKKLYIFLTILFICSFPFFLEVNTSLASETIVLMGKYLFVQFKILILVLAFTFFAVLDRNSFIGSLTSKYVLFLIFGLGGLIFALDMVVMPFVIIDIVQNKATPDEIININKEFAMSMYGLMQIPIAYIVCWIPAKLISIYKPSNIVIILHVLFSFLILKVIFFDIEDYSEVIKSNISQLFVINFTNLEYFQWSILFIITLKNIYIFKKEISNFKIKLSALKWFIFLAFFVLSVNLMKTYYLINYQPELIITVFIVLITWMITLSLENINMMISSIIYDLEKYTREFKSLILVLLLPIVFVLFSNFLMQNNGLLSQIFMWSITAILGFYFLKFYSLCHIEFIYNDEPSLDIYKLFIFTVVSIFVYNYEDSISAFLFISIGLIFALNYFIRYFSLKLHVIMAIFIIIIVNDSDLIRDYLVLFKDFIDLSILLEFLSETSAEATSWFTEYFKAWDDIDSIVNGPDYNSFERLFGYIFYVGMWIFLILAFFPWMIAAFLKMIVIFLLGIIGAFFVVGYLLLKISVVVAIFILLMVVLFYVFKYFDKILVKISK